MGWSPSLWFLLLGKHHFVGLETVKLLKGETISGHQKCCLASEDGKRRESNKHQHIEIKGKAAEHFCNGKHNQAIMDVELSGRRMYESSESTVNKLCNGAKKGDHSTQCRSKNPKYDTAAKVEKAS
jgi:hypothetical protein